MPMLKPHTLLSGKAYTKILINATVCTTPTIPQSCAYVAIQLPLHKAAVYMVKCNNIISNQYCNHLNVILSGRNVVQ